MWRSLELKGHQIPEKVRETILRELDPDGCQQGTEHKLKRRQYPLMQDQIPSRKAMSMIN